MHRLSVLSRLMIIALILLIAAGLSWAGTATGKEQHATQKMTKKDLPPAVLTAFEKAYPVAGISRISVVTQDSVKCYQIVSREGKTRRTLLYTEDGQVVKPLPKAAKKVEKVEKKTEKVQQKSEANPAKTENKNATHS